MITIHNYFQAANSKTLRMQWIMSTLYTPANDDTTGITFLPAAPRYTIMLCLLSSSGPSEDLPLVLSNIVNPVCPNPMYF